MPFPFDILALSCHNGQPPQSIFHSLQLLCLQEHCLLFFQACKFNHQGAHIATVGCSNAKMMEDVDGKMQVQGQVTSKRFDGCKVVICFWMPKNDVFSRVLRDSTPRYVGPSVGRSLSRWVGWSVGRSVGRSVGPLFRQRPRRGQ